MSSTFNPDEHFLPAEVVARRYHISESTLANHRAQGTGLQWTKIGGRVLYPQSGLAIAEDVGARGMCEQTLGRAVARVFGKVSDEKVKALWNAFCEEAKGAGRD